MHCMRRELSLLHDAVQRKSGFPQGSTAALAYGRLYPQTSKRPCQQGKPACSGTTAGYPTVHRGSVSTYVLILQDALNALGYSTRTLDGKFGPNTESALRGFQRSVGLSVDGICGCNTWKKLTAAVVGIGRTRTVID